MFFPPFNPALEVFRFHLVAVYYLALEISIDFVQVEAVSTRDLRGGFQDVGTQFVEVAGLARIVAGSLDTSGQ